MNILILGSGGREHALAWRLKQSPRVTQIIAAPGNPGIAELAECVPVAADNIEGLVDLARIERPNLVIVGPEVPLVMGLADKLRAIDIPVFGPSARAAMACSTVSIVVSGEPTNPASASLISAVPRFARSAEVTASIRARPFNSTLPSTGVPSAIVTPHAMRPVLFAFPFGFSPSQFQKCVVSR